MLLRRIALILLRRISLVLLRGIAALPLLVLLRRVALVLLRGVALLVRLVALLLVLVPLLRWVSLVLGWVTLVLGWVSLLLVLLRGVLLLRWLAPGEVRPAVDSDQVSLPYRSGTDRACQGRHDTSPPWIPENESRSVSRSMSPLRGIPM